MLINPIEMSEITIDRVIKMVDCRSIQWELFLLGPVSITPVYLLTSPTLLRIICGVSSFDQGMAKMKNGQIRLPYPVCAFP